MAVTDRLAHAWNAFFDSSPPKEVVQYGPSAMGGSSFAPSRSRVALANERTTIASIYSRISIDVSGAMIKHVRLDDQDRFSEVLKTPLNRCLTLKANIDQGGRAFRRDIASTIINRGVCAIVPVVTSISPDVSGGYDIQNLRVGHVVRWFPKHVTVSLYNEETGNREEVTLPKTFVAIVENPFYDVMNEPNSTLQRLLRKLSILDAIDEQSGSGKLDLIIQLPYVVKTDARKLQAEQRRQDIEFQLKGSQYGIAYTDGTEKITQLNRPAENNLLTQIEYLTKKLYSELGLTEEILNGTADEATMLGYYNRIVEPILDAIVEAMKDAFLTRTAQSQGQSIEYFRDPFKFVPLSAIAEIADKFTRNEIASSNEMRQAVGWVPSKDPNADKLRNSNMPQPSGPPTQGAPAPQQITGPQDQGATAA